MPLLFHNLRHLLNSENVRTADVNTNKVSVLFQAQQRILVKLGASAGTRIMRVIKHTSFTVYFRLEERSQHCVSAETHKSQSQTACGRRGQTLEVFRLPLLRSVLMDC